MNMLVVIRFLVCLGLVGQRFVLIDELSRLQSERLGRALGHAVGSLNRMHRNFFLGACFILLYQLWRGSTQRYLWQFLELFILGHLKIAIVLLVAVLNFLDEVDYFRRDLLPLGFCLFGDDLAQ